MDDTTTTVPQRHLAHSPARVLRCGSQLCFFSLSVENTVFTLLYFASFCWWYHPPITCLPSTCYYYSPADTTYHSSSYSSLSVFAGQHCTFSTIALNWFSLAYPSLLCSLSLYLYLRLTETSADVICIINYLNHYCSAEVHFLFAFIFICIWCVGHRCRSLWCDRGCGQTVCHRFVSQLASTINVTCVSSQCEPSLLLF